MLKFASLALVLTLATGCGGHLSNTVGSRAGVYFSASNAWGAATVIRIDDAGALHGNTYSSLDDAQQAIATGFEPNTGDYTGEVTGSITCPQPFDGDKPCAMTLRVEIADKIVTATGPASWTLDGLDETSPLAAWTEVA